jgi:hypothetical protein
MDFEAGAKKAIKAIPSRQTILARALMLADETSTSIWNV